jgi:hypothetical protein
MVLLAELVAHLDRHVQREEDGIFRALRAEGEFMDEIDALDGEHGASQPPSPRSTPTPRTSPHW